MAGSTNKPGWLYNINEATLHQNSRVRTNVLHMKVYGTASVCVCVRVCACVRMCSAHVGQQLPPEAWPDCTHKFLHIQTWVTPSWLRTMLEEGVNNVGVSP